MFSQKKQLSGQRSTGGFTLIEVVLAALVLLVGLIGVIQVISSGAEMLDVSRKQAIAMRIIHSEIEKLRLFNWDLIANTSGNSPPDLPSPSTATVDGTGSTMIYDTVAGATPAVLKKIEVETQLDSSFKCTRTIEPVLGENYLRKITFTVTWQRSNGRSYSRSSFTYFGKNGLYVAFQRS